MESVSQLPHSTHLMDHTSDRMSSADAPIDFAWNYEYHPLSPLPEKIPGEPTPSQAAQTELLSECLRDGLHGVAVYPPVEKLLQYVEMLNRFGIQYATVGIYSGEKKDSDTTKELLTRMRDRVPSVVPSVLSICTPASMKWTAECKDIHPALESVIFMGSAPSRRLVQGWDLDFILRRMEQSISEATRLGIPVLGATEHTTQTSPDDLRKIIRVQVESGAYRFAIADTVGILRPQGAYRIVRFVRDVLDDLNAQHVKIDWHGHRDTGNALSNSLMAIAAGANRIHVVSRGIGERSGNAPLEEVLLNLAAILEEAEVPVPWNMSQLLDLISFYQKMVGVTTPEHGVLGKRYSYTSLGIHTDAILKANALADNAKKMEDVELERKLRKMARTVYSAVDPLTIGGQCSVGVSQWSGQSSVKLAYMQSGRDPEQLSPEMIEYILAKAKALGRELETTELEECFAEAHYS
jgi:Isopropylmalate/homocitrate/citramalate synthases